MFTHDVGSMFQQSRRNLKTKVVITPFLGSLNLTLVSMMLSLITIPLHLSGSPETSVPDRSGRRKYTNVSHLLLVLVPSVGVVPAFAICCLVWCAQLP